MSQIIYHLQLIDMVGWLKISRYCIYFYPLIFNFPVEETGEPEHCKIVMALNLSKE